MESNAHEQQHSLLTEFLTNTLPAMEQRFEALETKAGVFLAGLPERLQQLEQQVATVSTPTVEAVKDALVRLKQEAETEVAKIPQPWPTARGTAAQQTPAPAVTGTVDVSAATVGEDAGAKAVADASSTPGAPGK